MDRKKESDMKKVQVTFERGISKIQTSPFTSKTWAEIYKISDLKVSGIDISDIDSISDKEIFLLDSGKPVTENTLEDFITEFLEFDTYHYLILVGTVSIQENEVIVQKSREYTLLGQIISSAAWIKNAKG